MSPKQEHTKEIGQMSNSELAEINTKGLKKLYEDDATAQTILDYFATRQRGNVETSVDRLELNLKQRGTPVSRREIIGVLKELQQLNCGEFRHGRKGYPSRFAWDSVSLIDVGRYCTGETDSIAPLSEEEKDDEHNVEFITHSYVLRADLDVTLELPSNLNRREAERLGEFIKTLAFE